MDSASMQLAVRRACSTCARIGKTCDLQLPRCSLCTRMRLICTYPTTQCIVAESPDRAAQNSFPRKPSHELIPLSRDLQRTAISSQVGEAFWTAYIPTDEHGCGGVSAWRESQERLASQDALVRTSLDALQLSIAGQQRNDPQLTRASTRLYARALGATSRALQDTTRASSDEVLSTCVTFAMYEVFRPCFSEEDPSSLVSGWDHHLNGVSRLVELRCKLEGSSQHMQLATSSSIHTALLLRRSFRLLEFGYRAGSSSQSLLDRLLDRLAPIPQLLEAQDTFSADLFASMPGMDPPEMFSRGRALLDRCIRAAIHLRAWELHAVAFVKDGHSDVTMYATNPELDGPMAELENTYASQILGRTCMVPGHRYFHVMMYYWSASVLLHSGTRAIYRQLVHTMRSSAPPGTTPVAPLPSWMDSARFAGYVAKHSDYYFRPAAGLWDTLQSLLPVVFALRHYAVEGQLTSKQARHLMSLYDGTVLSAFAKGLIERATSLVQPSTTAEW